MKVINHHGLKLWIHEDTDMGMFRGLDPQEIQDFRDWAKDHLTETVKPIWHPIVQDTIYRSRAVVITHRVDSQEGG